MDLLINNCAPQKNYSKFGTEIYKQVDMQEKGSIVFQNTVKSTPNLFSKSNFFFSLSVKDPLQPSVNIVYLAIISTPL